MITGIAVVPGALALLPEMVGRIDVLADLRAAAHEAVEDVTSDAERVVVVTATDREPRHTEASIGRRVAEVLLDGRPAEWSEIAWDATVSECLARGVELAADCAGGTLAALVIVADGSACRTEKAPGHFDERAAGFDEAWLSALRRADAAALGALDPVLATELLAHGRAPLQVLAGLLSADANAEGGTWLCESLERSDPFGVMYAVARLRPH